MFKACRQATNILMSSYEETALMTGISDIIAVQWQSSKFKTTPFLVCFGSLSHRARQQKIKLYINDSMVEDVNFQINKYGYLQPFHPSSETIAKFKLVHGKNLIKFETSSVTLQAQIYLYNLNDKIIISDMDGTMTKTDLMGLLSNYRETHYIHDGYETFINELSKNGYKIVWVTMRSISMYKFSKKYINKYVGCEGALIPEPQQFFPSIKKQLMKRTSNIKTNMMKTIRELFPVQINPLVGGLGNRQNDAIAYLALGIPLDRIYIVSQKSQILTMKNELLKNYMQLHEQIESHFPKVSQISMSTALNLKQTYSQSSNTNQNKDVMSSAAKNKKMKQFFQGLRLENQ